MLSNGETLLFIEMPIFSRDRPEDTVVGAIRQPMRVLQGLDSMQTFRRPICEWLAKLSHTEVGSLMGVHAGYLDRPEDTASGLRPYLQQVIAPQPTEQGDYSTTAAGPGRTLWARDGFGQRGNCSSEIRAEAAGHGGRRRFDERAIVEVLPT